MKARYVTTPAHSVQGKGGLYVHVPYCKQKCIYCDFYSGGSRIADWRRYVKGVLNELEARLPELPHVISTLYFGGGTPSLMPKDAFLHLVDGIRRLAGGRMALEEFTLEANPEDVTREMLETWRQAGVDRLSIGVQTLEDELLRKIGRRHDASRALEALDESLSVFDNVSVDVMFGIPGQRLESWEQTLKTLIERKPPHVSCYSLMYEPGTALTLLRDRGDVKEADEDLSGEMYMEMRTMLESNGYEGYEISNFALPGFRSRHNHSYWTGKPYLGLGPAAHSYDGDRLRSANPGDVKGYLKAFAPEKGEWGEWKRQEERLSDEELWEEMILTRLRTSEGVLLDEVRSRFGEDALRRLLVDSAGLVKDGKMVADGASLRLSREGVMISDAIMVRLM